jgi:hypothetical protein
MGTWRSVFSVFGKRANSGPASIRVEVCLPLLLSPVLTIASDHFDVASVKPAPMRTPIRTHTPGRIRYSVLRLHPSALRNVRHCPFVYADCTDVLPSFGSGCLNAIGARRVSQSGGSHEASGDLCCRIDHG